MGKLDKDLSYIENSTKKLSKRVKANFRKGALTLAAFLTIVTSTAGLKLSAQEKGSIIENLRTAHKYGTEEQAEKVGRYANKLVVPIENEIKTLVHRKEFLAAWNKVGVFKGVVQELGDDDLVKFGERLEKDLINGIAETIQEYMSEGRLREAEISISGFERLSMEQGSDEGTYMAGKLREELVEAHKEKKLLEEEKQRERREAGALLVNSIQHNSPGKASVQKMKGKKYFTFSVEGDNLHEAIGGRNYSRFMFEIRGAGVIIEGPVLRKVDSEKSGRTICTYFVEIRR